MNTSPATDSIVVESDAPIHTGTGPTRPLDMGKIISYSLANLGYGAFYALNNAVLPLFLEQYTKNNVLIGLLSSSDSIEGAVIQPVVGSASDRLRTRWGRRRPFIAVCIPLAALFVLLTPVVAHLPVGIRLAAIIACVFLFTLLFTIAWDPYQALMPDITPVSQRGKVMAIASLFGMVGQAGLMLLPMPLPLKFGLTVALMLITTFATCVLIREPRLPATPGDTPAHSHLRELREALEGLRVLRQAGKALLTLFLSGVGIGAVFPFLTLFVKKVTGGTDQQAQQMFVVLMVAGALTVVPFGWLTDKIGPKRVTMLGLGLTAFAALNGLWITTLEQVAFVLAFAGVGNAALSAARYPLLTELVPAEEVGFYTGLQTTAMSLALPVTSVLTGVMINEGGYRNIFTICAIGVIASMFVLATLKMREAADEVAARRNGSASEGLVFAGMGARVISGIVGIALFLGICFWGALPFALAATVVAAMGATEFVAAYRRALYRERAMSEGLRPLGIWLNVAITYVGVTFPLIAYSGIVFQLQGRPVGSADWTDVLLFALPIGLFAARAARAARTGRALGKLRAVYGLVGLAYIGLLFSSFVLLRALPGRVVVPPFPAADKGAWLMLFVAVCVWATDTFAYLVGRSLGKHKLAPTLSPKKTIEGSLGGLAGAMLVGAAFGGWIHLPLVHGLAIGALAGVVGQIGDLFESAMKREIGVKDFGNVMPGHGGILDRFDSLLFVAPLAYLYLRLVAGL